ncbi:MAG: membrane dipeptidase [Ktedonobacteraceae bacterium]
MFIIDAHEDIAYNALAWGRDIRLSAYTTRERAAQHPENIGHSIPGDLAMNGLPDLRRGSVGVVFGVIFTFPMQVGNGEEGRYSQSYRTAEEAHQAGQQQLAYYKELAQEAGISLVLNQRDLAHVLTAWQHSSPDDPQRPLGLVPLLEGADPIRTPAEAAQWFADGLRIVGLAWTSTRYSGGTHAPGPLTPAGRELLTEMERVGLILDISHLAEESFWQALAHFSGPLMASHSNCRALTPTDRHLSDDMIRALAERDAIIGIVAANPFLTHTWQRTNRFPVGFERMVRHIDHICQLTGNALHVGIGSDIDGGFGRDETPTELDTIADLPKLAAALRSANYPEEAILNIMGGNWRRFLARALPM